MMYIKVIIGSMSLLLGLSGCAKVVSACPKFPTPTQEVLDKIKNLNSLDVDVWVGELYKLNLKLKYCLGE